MHIHHGVGEQTCGQGVQGRNLVLPIGRHDVQDVQIAFLLLLRWRPPQVGLPRKGSDPFICVHDGVGEQTHDQGVQRRDFVLPVGRHGVQIGFTSVSIAASFLELQERALTLCLLFSSKLLWHQFPYVDSIVKIRLRRNSLASSSATRNEAPEARQISASSCPERLESTRPAK